MYKRTKIRVAIFFHIVVLILFSQTLFARPLHFIAYGDTRRDIWSTDKPQEKHNAIAKVIQEVSPDLILFSGDMVYYNEFDTFLEVINDNYAKGKRIPLYPAIGNHELIFGENIEKIIQTIQKIGTSNKTKEQAVVSSLKEIENLKEKLYHEVELINVDKLKKRSRQVFCEEICGKLDAEYVSYLKKLVCETAPTQSWYAFEKDVNGLKIKFIALNSSLPDDKEQFEWFINEVKKFRGPKIILAHHPPYSLGFHGCLDLRDNQSKASRFRNRYKNIFHDISNNILLIVSGHDHNYQRICNKDKTGAIIPPVYIVTGGGGADLGGKGECDLSQIPFDGLRCLVFDTAYHFLDIIADTNDDGNLTITCKVKGLRYDLTKGLPDDETFGKQFVKKQLETIDNFDIQWQSKK